MADEERLSAVQLRTIRELLIEPFERQFLSIDDSIKQLRTDLREGFKQNEAILRTITDAEMGYVPRPQIQLMQQVNDAEHDRLNARIDQHRRDASKDDEELEARINDRWNTLYRQMWVAATLIVASVAAVAAILKI